MQILGKANFTQDPTGKKSGKNSSHSKIEETLQFLKLPTEVSDQNMGLGSVTRYDFPLIPSGMIYGQMLIFPRRETSLHVLHMYGKEESLCEECKKFRLHKSPLEIDCAKLLAAFSFEDKKNVRESKRSIYSISENLSQTAKGKKSHLLLVEYYKWLYHRHVADEERDPADFPALSKEEINELMYYLK